ncbi:MAG: hypothetical protein FJ215_10585 [Ignavibacteria bacterium]|nr:hypothetical protein [Ignavibacteria bacterium]
MASATRIRFSAQMTIGLVVITVGLIFLLGNLDLIEVRDYLRYWPVLLILVGLPRTIQPPGSPGRMFGFFLIGIGVLLLLDAIAYFDIRFWDFWPLILILIGLALLKRSTRSRLRPTVLSGSGEASMQGEEALNEFVLLGGKNLVSTTTDFKGGAATAIMGGCKIDLRKASMKGESAVIDVFTFWGGIELIVPDDWSIALEGVPILGGMEDKSVPPKGKSPKTLVIKGYAIMGGVEIKN